MAETDLKVMESDPGIGGGKKQFLDCIIYSLKPCIKKRTKTENQKNPCIPDVFQMCSLLYSLLLATLALFSRLTKRVVSFRWEMSVSTWYLRAGKNLPKGKRPQCFPRQEYHREDPFQTALASREPGEDTFWDRLNFFQDNFQPSPWTHLRHSLPPPTPSAPPPLPALG